MSIKKPLAGFSFFAIISLLVTLVIWNTLQRGVDGSTRSYEATFSDVLGLKSGDDVRIAGVRVGRVNSIKLTDQGNARVDLEVRTSEQVYGDTKLAVRYQNLIGQRYIALLDADSQKAQGLTVVGEHNPLPDGAKIGIEHTEPSLDISTLLGGMQPLFKELDPVQINNLTGTFIQAFQGDQTSISAFITQTVALANTFNDRDQLLGDVITNLSGVIDGLGKRSDQFETLLAQARTLVAGLYQQGHTLQDSTVRISKATSSLSSMVSQIRPTIAQAQNNATSAMQILLGAGAKLDGTAYDGPQVLTDLARISGEGTYLGLYPCQLDIALYNLIFPRGLFTQVGGNAHSEVCS